MYIIRMDLLRKTIGFVSKMKASDSVMSSCGPPGETIWSLEIKSGIAAKQFSMYFPFLQLLEVPSAFFWTKNEFTFS